MVGFNSARAFGLSHSRLHNVISNALEKARGQGSDETHQYEFALSSVRRVAPDLTINDAARLVNAALEARE
jgi:hypothetical protein